MGSALTFRVFCELLVVYSCTVCVYLMFWIWLFWYIRYGEAIAWVSSLTLVRCLWNRMYCHWILELLLSDAVTAWECEEPKILGEKKGVSLLTPAVEEKHVWHLHWWIIESRFLRDQLITQEHILVQVPPESTLKIPTRLTLFYLPLF